MIRRRIYVDLCLISTSVIKRSFKKRKTHQMCIMLSPKSSSANNYFLLMDFLQSCDFYMVCKPSWDFSYQLAWWLLASFQHLYIFLLAAACFECYSSYFPIAERGSEYWIPIHPLHTRHGFQNSEAPFPPQPLPQINYYLLSSLLPLSTPFSTWFFLLGEIRTVHQWWTVYRLVLRQVDIQ